MAMEELDDGEFWLPQEFLTDDDVLKDFRQAKPKLLDAGGYGGGGVLGAGFFGTCGSGLNSDLSSPVESVMGSTETESDEEEYLTGLTRMLAHSTLHKDDLWKNEPGFGYGFENSKPRVIAGSPQSTLCDFKLDGGGSSRGSPQNCLSPPSTAGSNRNEAAWDLLYAAAGEVARMKMAEEIAAAASSGFYPSRGLGAPTRRQSPASAIQHHNPVTANLCSNNNSLPYLQLQTAQFEQLKQHQLLKQQQIQQIRARNNRVVASQLPLSLSAWPTLQQSQQQQQQQNLQKSGSGMRAVFLGNPGGTKRECTGTGVFLPRQIGAPAENRKKRGCSTVLLPDRVVQALNLNLEAMEAQSQLQSRCDQTMPSDYEADMRYRNSLLMAAHQRRNIRQQQASMSNEVRLPQEWTY